MDEPIKNKRRPGIPDEALSHIIQQAGGTLTRSLDERNKMLVRVDIGGQYFRAADNTRLLIEMIKAIN
jgi:hypothetical protein